MTYPTFARERLDADAHTRPDDKPTRSELYADAHRPAESVCGGCGAEVCGPHSAADCAMLREAMER